MTRVFALIGLLALVVAGAASAEQWRSYDLGDYRFGAPESWSVTLRRDDEIDLQSPDGRYMLWARLWFPDEPLLGFTDIVSHGTLSLAGQEVMFRHSEYPSERFLEYIVQRADAQQRYFLFQLIGNLDRGAPLDEHQAIFQRLAAELVIDGVRVLSDEVAGAVVAPAALPSPGATTEADWLPLVNAGAGAGDCHFVNLAAWPHPARAVLEGRGIPLRFAALCRGDRLPVFGVDLPADPRLGANDGFFRPLLAEMFEANWQSDFALFDAGFAVMVEVQGRDRPAMSIDYRDLPLP